MPPRVATSAPWVGLGLLTLILAGCGGGSSSNTGPSSGGGGGSSGAVVQGQLRSRTASTGESVVVLALERVLGIGVAEAAPIASMTVQLVDQANPSHVLSTTTDANGNFLFTGVPTGTYEVVVPGFVLTPTPTLITVDIGDKGIVDGVVDGSVILATAEVTVNDINDFLQNPAQLCKAVTVANATNTSLDQIITERLSGKGWGRIVQDHGGHPSMLGDAGHCSDAEIATANSLANGTGKSNGHANGNGKGQGNANGNGKGKKKGQS